MTGPYTHPPPRWYARESEVQRARDAIYVGKLVECTGEEYLATVRAGLQEYAGECIDSGDGVRAWHALEEVKRLDALYPPF